MNSLLGRFPDVYRYAHGELRPARLAFGAAASFLVGVCLLVMAGASRRSQAEALFHYVLGLQSMILLGYGTARTAGSIIEERQEGTWDLQRLTPLSSWEVAAGKLLGAPLFALFLFMTLMPWSLASLVLWKGVEPGLYLRAYEALAVAAFLSWSIGLVVSAYSAESVTGAYSSSTGVLVGLFSMQAFIPVMALMSREGRPIPYYGLHYDASILWSFSAASVGVWALAGAKWRIGKDFLEGPRWWRLPAFLAFIVWYELGWWSPGSRFPRHAVLLAPALLVYMASVLNSETLEHWKGWLGRGAAAPHRAPVWLNGLGAFGFLSVGVLLLCAAGPVSSEKGWFLYPTLQALFLARDLAFLQWCRLTGLRRPEVVALACIGLAYLLPAILIGTLEIWNLRYLYVPIPNPEHGPFTNILPGLLQAGAMAWVLARRLRPALK